MKFGSFGRDHTLCTVPSVQQVRLGSINCCSGKEASDSPVIRFNEAFNRQHIFRFKSLATHEDPAVHAQPSRTLLPTRSQFSQPWSDHIANRHRNRLHKGKKQVQVRQMMHECRIEAQPCDRMGSVLCLWINGTIAGSVRLTASSIIYLDG